MADSFVDFQLKRKFAMGGCCQVTYGIVKVFNAYLAILKLFSDAMEAIPPSLMMLQTLLLRYSLRTVVLRAPLYLYVLFLTADVIISSFVIYFYMSRKNDWPLYEDRAHVYN